MSSVRLRVTLTGDTEIFRLLQKLPALVVASGGPTDRAVNAATQIIHRRAKQIAPDSNKTGTRKKQSKKSRAIWNHKLRDTIRRKTKRYEFGSFGIVGPKSPEGNMSHFMQEKPRRLVLWGRTTRVARYRIEKNWMTRAFDETRPEQLDAMRSELTRAIKENMTQGQ